MFHPNNNTTSLGSEEARTWTFIPVYSLTVFLGAIVSTSSVLYLFIRHSHLRTAFSVYLINLLAASLVSQLIQVPIYLVANLEPYWWIGRNACTIYIYGFFVQAGMCNAHALISINRLWAVLRPISYKRNHTKRVAWMICGAMWVYIHVLTFPGFLKDVLYYRLPEQKYGCFLNKGPQMGWAYVHQLMVFNLPVCIMVLSYPVVCYKTWICHKTLRRGSVQPATTSSRTKSTETERPEKIAIVTVGAPKNNPTSRTFWVLTIVTAGMLVFWFPTIVFYTAGLFQDTSGWTGVGDAATVLLFLESVTDPILFTLALTDLRTAYAKTYLGWRVHFVRR